MNDISIARIGDNSGRMPLAQQIAEELAEQRARADELLTEARAARVETAHDAGKVADLILLMRAEERALEIMRDKRKQPIQLDIRVIDAAYGVLIGPLARARTGPESLTERLEGWQRAHPDEAPVSSIAAVGARRAPVFVIEDIPAVIAWLVDNRPGELLQAARTIVGTVIRQAGVQAAADLCIPGVAITVETRAQVR